MSDVFTEAAKPLLEAYDKLEGEISEREAELGQLREQRNRVKAAVRALDPERFRKNKPKSTAASRVGATKLAQARDWLQEHAKGTFTSVTLTESGSTWPTPNRKMTNMVLQALHEEDSIRLLRMGRGGLKYWEVVR